MGQEVFVGTAEGLHVLGDERRVRVAGHDVRSLARGETGWWAIIDSGAIWQSNAADWWTPVASMEELQANCLLPAKNGPFIGTSGAHIQALRGEALSPVDSFEETEGRETWYTPWGGPPDVRSMSIDPSGVIFANVHVGGVGAVHGRRDVVAADNRHTLRRTSGAIQRRLRVAARGHRSGARR